MMQQGQVNVELEPLHEGDHANHAHEEMGHGHTGYVAHPAHLTWRQRIFSEQFRPHWYFGGLMFLALLVALIAGVLPVTPTPDLYARFRNGCTATGARDSLQKLTELAHLAGSPQDYQTALFVQQAYIDAGLPEVVLEEYDVLLNYPNGNDAVVEITSPPSAVFKAGLKEAVVSVDPLTSTSYAGPFHGYAPSGDVTAPVVYAHYGRVQDFEYLRNLGVQINGSIVIMRYGHLFRGNKVVNAEANGAVAAIIYSDPASDGYVNGKTYPEGPWRPETSLQRGTVFIGNGDPTSPDMPSTKHALHWTVWEARQKNSVLGWQLPTIPSIPLSWGDAKPILAAMGGPAVPEDWVGGLPITYRVGGTAEPRLRVKVANTFVVTPLWNVLGIIPGSVEPDRYVVLGNHRDAWVAGAVDPSSGMASLIETARGLGGLVKSGWQPQRSIMLASWDGEEYGLMGSTEHVERYAQKLTNEAVVYINADESVEGMGPFIADACPQLNDLVFEVTKTIAQPPCVPFGVMNGSLPYTMCNDVPPGTSVYDFWVKYNPSTTDATQPYINILGDGSDHAAFMAHLGVSAINFGFSPVEDYYAVYHSVYDSFHWMETFGDPLFEHHAAAGQVWGVLAIRFATDPILPFDYRPYGKLLMSFHFDLRTLVGTLGGSDAPPVGGVQPGEEDGAPDHPSPFPVPHTLDLARLNATIQRFVLGTNSMAAEIAALAANPMATPLQLRQMNDRLMQIERSFILPAGLKGHAWYRHVIFSPSSYNAYGATSFPAVSDALAIGDWRTAQEQLDIVCHLIQRGTDLLINRMFQYDPSL